MSSRSGNFCGRNYSETFIVSDNFKLPGFSVGKGEKCSLPAVSFYCCICHWYHIPLPISFRIVVFMHYCFMLSWFKPKYNPIKLCGKGQVNISSWHSLFTQQFTPLKIASFWFTCIFLIIFLWRFFWLLSWNQPKYKVDKLNLMQSN